MVGRSGAWTELAQAEQAIARWDDDLAADDALGTWAIAPLMTGRPVGWVVLCHLPGDEAVQIGWSLHPKATGRGWAAEAAAALLQHGLDAGLSDIWALMWAHNEPSARVARTIGMHELGILPDPWYGTAEDPDSLMFNTNSDARQPHNRETDLPIAGRVVSP